MTDLSLVDTIIIVMLENRSFDHILGHLSYDTFANGSSVDGLTDPLNRSDYENLDGAQPYYPFLLRDGKLVSDLPHEREEVARELALSQVTGKFSMSGFVSAYFAKTGVNRTTTPDPMGFLAPPDLPVTRFLADNFTVCDKWFASIPTSTQPNRLMFLSGATRIDHTAGVFPPTDALVIDWLSAHGVSWRVYHSGISFFALLGRAEIFGPNFRGIDHLAHDVATEAPSDFPQVIMVEPSYADAPHIGSDVPNDNHPPLAVAPGEAFLGQIYDALTSNPARWARSVLIVTYDEHGGFFDHVPPPPIPYQPASNATFKLRFESLGVRVPGLVISPLVTAKSVFSKTLDHTSILQLLADKFDRGTPYSPSVGARQKLGIHSLSEVLGSTPRADIAARPPVSLQATLAFGGPSVATTPMQQAFEGAASWMVTEHAKPTAQEYPEITHWALTRASSSKSPPGKT